jgi:hypothetical protein
MYSHRARFYCGMQTPNRYYELLTGAVFIRVFTKHFAIKTLIFCIGSSELLLYTEVIHRTQQKHFTFFRDLSCFRHILTNLAFFIDTHHVRNTAVYDVEGQLPIMAQLLNQFYSVYIFFERAHLLIYPEPDEFNSKSLTISLTL